VLLRGFFALPHLVWLAGWTLLVLVCVSVQWLFVLVIGRGWRPLFRFTTAYLRYTTHLGAYLALVANPFPGFLGWRGYPVELMHPGIEHQSRWKTLVRGVLAIPAWVFSQTLDRVVDIVSFLGWFACIALGRMPQGMRDLNAYALRYRQQTLCYLLLVTDAYPRLASAEEYSADET
jgi:hypothetical protein